MIARMTNAKPETNPAPISACCNADNTPFPNPGAPIIDAVTTIESANIIVWFTPANMVFFANGSSTLNSL